MRDDEEEDDEKTRVARICANLDDDDSKEPLKGGITESANSMEFKNPDSQRTTRVARPRAESPDDPARWWTKEPATTEEFLARLLGYRNLSLGSNVDARGQEEGHDPA